MATLEMVEQELQKFEVNKATLQAWEQELGLNIPTDANGQKQYSRHHINLFKNIKKHMTLGRTLDQIRSTLVLPPAETARVIEQEAANPPPVQPQPQFSPLPELDLAIKRPQQASPALERKEAPTPYASTPAPVQLPHQETSSVEALNNYQPPEEPAFEAPFPDVEAQRPEPVTKAEPPAPTLIKTREEAPSPSASQPPARLSEKAPMGAIGQTQALQLIDRLLNEKESIQNRLVEAEKLNSHLYNVNNLFHRKVKELSSLVVKLKSNNREEINMKLMDDKAKLHRQLLDSEKARLDAERDHEKLAKQVDEIRNEKEQIQTRLEQITSNFDPQKLLGTWQEEATLKQVVFDNFGIHAEAKRSSQRQIKRLPERCFGNAAIVQAQYEYESNPLWRRNEIATLAYQSDNRLVGDLQVDYILDGVTVAQCIYQIEATRA